jgi:hypothetical protein
MHDIKMVTETDARLTTHEQICAERYEGIQARFDDYFKRMTKIEYLLYALIAAVLLGPGVAAEFVKKLLGL